MNFKNKSTSKLVAISLFALLCASGALILNDSNNSNAAINETDGLDYTVADGCLTISGTGAMQAYTVSANLRTLYTFTTCIIESGVTSIGAYAFYNCPNLTSVTIPDSVTTIENCAFFACTNLTSIVIPDSVTTIGTSTFANCTGLTSVTIPDSVTTIGNTIFQNCPAMTSVIISKFLMSISQQAFDGCTGLTSIVIPDSVTYFGGGAFDGCTSLTNMYCVGSAGSITFISDVPSTCTISYDVTYTVTFDITTAPSIIGGITTPDAQIVPAGSSPTDPALIIDGYVISWYSDSALTTRFDFISVITADMTAYLGIASIPDNLDYTVTDGCLTISGTGAMQDYTDEVNLSTLYTFTTCIIGSGVTSIGAYAFMNCMDLTSVTISDSVTSIGAYAFNNCTGLTSVTISDSVTSIGAYAFDTCTSLTNMYCVGSAGSITFISDVPSTCTISYDYQIPVTSDDEGSVTDEGMKIAVHAGIVCAIIALILTIAAIKGAYNIFVVGGDVIFTLLTIILLFFGLFT